jgi:hypothetical protein
MAHLFWISFDIDYKTNVEPLYRWLDKHNAKECGFAIAGIRMEESETSQSLEDYIRSTLIDSMDLSASDRIYLIYKRSGEQTGYQGTFLHGARTKAIWDGYNVENENAGF